MLIIINNNNMLKKRSDVINKANAGFENPKVPFEYQYLGLKFSAIKDGLPQLVDLILTDLEIQKNDQRGFEKPPKAAYRELELTALLYRIYKKGFSIITNLKFFR